MFKAIAGVIVALFVVTSGAPSQRSERQVFLNAGNDDGPHHKGIEREFYVFPAFLRGKFAKRKVGYLVFGNHQIDKPRFLSLKDKRYDEALALIQSSGVYRGAPAERAFSPLFDSSVYRKPSFTIRRGIIIPKNEEKILQRKTEADELHSTDDNFESSLIQRLQDLKKESHSRSSGIDQEQDSEKTSQAQANADFQKLSVSDSDDSLTHMAFESDVGFDVDLEGFVTNESVIQNTQGSNNNADDAQGSSGIFRTDSGSSSNFGHTSTGINADSSIGTDTDHFSQPLFPDNGNDGGISESFSSSIKQKSESESKSQGSADDDTATSAGSSTFNFPFSSLHFSNDEIVQAILALSDSSNNVENLQDDSSRIPFRIFDGTLIANRFGNSAPIFNDDADITSSILTVPYTKSESLLLINQGRRTENSKPIYIKTYVLRFGHKNRHSKTGDSEASDSSSDSKPSAVILGFRDAVNHGLTDDISEISVRLVEDDEEMRENLRNKRHIFSFDFDDISIEVLE